MARVLSRILIRRFRHFVHLDVPVTDKVTCVVGENNTGNSLLVHVLRLACVCPEMVGGDVLAIGFRDFLA